MWDWDLGGSGNVLYCLLLVASLDALDNGNCFGLYELFCFFELDVYNSQKSRIHTELFLGEGKNYLVYLKGKRRSGMREEVRGFLLFGSLRDGRIGAVR